MRPRSVPRRPWCVPTILLATLLSFTALAVDPGPAPNEVQNLRFDSKVDLSWDALPAGTRYNLYRGNLATLPNSGGCLVQEVSPPGATDSATPSVGQAFFYLASGTTGLVEGTLGFRSDGLERVNLSPCPVNVGVKRATLDPNGVDVDGVVQGVQARVNPAIGNDLNGLAGGGVYMHTAEFFLELVDLEVPGNGFNWQLVRSYRSQINHDGLLGFNWTMNYDRRVVQDGPLLEYFDGMGSSWSYQPTGLPNLFEGVEPGIYSKMRITPDGEFELREPDGMIYRHFGIAGTPVDGMLQEIVDRLGNRMTFLYDGFGRLCHVIDTMGRQYDYLYDGDGRLTRVDDFQGRSVSYEYDAQGDLIAVTGPAVIGTTTGNDFPGGTTTRYRYLSAQPDPRLNHNLVEITAPGDGLPYLQNSYNARDELIAQFHGGTNASGIAAGGQFTFQLNPGMPRQLIHTNRAGFITEFEYDPVGHEIIQRRLTAGIHPGEPAFYETIHNYNPAGERVLTMLPQGGAVAYQYDEFNPDPFRRGNLIAVIRVPNPLGDGFGGSPSDIIAEYTYEPLYNQQSAVEDPRGNDPLFFNPARPDQYTTFTLFDYQEGDPLTNGVAQLANDWDIDLGFSIIGFDLNGDGITNQNFGNPIVVQQLADTLLGGRQELINGFSQEIETRYRYDDRGKIITKIDPENNVELFVYYPETDPDGDGLPTPAPLDGRTLDPLRGGYLSQHVHDADPAGILDASQIADRNNRTNPPATESLNRFVYDAAGNLIESVDGNGVATRFEVNAKGQIVSVQRGISDFSVGFRSEQIYNERGDILIRRVEDADGDATGDGFVDSTYEFDLLGNVVRVTSDVDPGTVATTEFRYDGQENRSAVLFPEGNIHTIGFDERGLPFRVTRGDDNLDPQDAPPPGASTQTIDYDPDGNPVVFVDGNGQPWNFEYDGFGRRIRGEVVPGESAYETRWNPNEQIASRQVVDQTLGGVVLHETRYLYDQLGRVQRIEQPLLDASGAPIFGEDADGDSIIVTLTEYDKNSRRTVGVTDMGGFEEFEYDGVGRVLRKVDAIGNSVDYNYDANGNLLATVETASGSGETFTNTYDYDELNRLVGKTDAAGSGSRFAYDSLDNLTFQEDRLGNTIQYAYDARGRRTQISRDLRQGGTGAGPVVDQIVHTFVWDLNGRLVSTIDPESNPTTYAYDDLDRKIRDELVDGSQLFYEYDANDNVVFMQDPNGTQFDAIYDAADRLTDRIAIPTDPNVVGVVQTFAYDRMNRMIGASNVNDLGDDAFIGREYDSLNRIRNELQRNNTLGSSASRQYTYDGDGRLITTNGGAVTYTYDPLGRVDSVSDPGVGLFTTYTHDGADLRRSRNNSNGSSSNFDFDPLKRIQQIFHQGPPGGPGDSTWEYLYDAEDNLIAELPQHAPNQGDVWRYDSAYRLTEFLRDVDDALAEATVPGSGGLVQRRTAYRLDRVGNWIEQDVQDLTGTVPSGTFGNQVDPLNQYGESPDDGVPDDFGDDLNTPAPDGVNLAYDLNGNLIQEGPRQYRYDAYNRVVQVIDLGVHTYLWDALNRRLSKTATGSRLYVYDGDRVVLESDLSAPFTSRQYYYGQEAFPIAAYDAVGGQLYHTQEDARGSIRAITDATGERIERFSYGPQGTPQFEDVNGVPTGATQSQIEFPFLYQGQYYDTETGFYLQGAAFFAPRFGRHVQRWPSGQATGPMAMLNPPTALPSFHTWIGMNAAWWCKGWFWNPGAWWVGRWAWRPFWWWGGPWRWWAWRPWLWLGQPWGWWGSEALGLVVGHSLPLVGLASLGALVRLVGLVALVGLGWLVRLAPALGLDRLVRLVALVGLGRLVRLVARLRLVGLVRLVAALEPVD